MPEGKNLEGARSVVVRTVANVLEAQLAEGALLAAGIPCAVEEYNLEGYWDSLFVPQKGWGRIRVAEPHAAQAREIVEAALTQVEVSEEELEKEAEETDEIPEEPEEKT